MNGFSINGVHSSELNIKLLETHKPLTPEIQDYREYIPGKHGSVMFPQAFGDKIIELSCLIRYQSPRTRTDQNRKLIQALYQTTECRIEFDHEPDVYYLGKMSESFEIEQYPTAGIFTLVYTCKPFAIAKEQKSIHATGETNEFKSSPIVVETKGTADTEFTMDVILSQVVPKLLIVVNDKALIYNAEIPTNHALKLDTERLEALLISSTQNEKNATLQLEGEFPLLKPGKNQLYLQSTVNFGYEINGLFSDRFL